MKMNTELTTLVLSIIILILVLTLFYKKSKRQENFENTVNSLPSIPVNNKSDNAYEPPRGTLNVSPNVEITGINEYSVRPDDQQTMMKALENIANDNPCEMKAQLKMNFSKMEQLQKDMRELKQSCGCKKN